MEHERNGSREKRGVGAHDVTAHFASRICRFLAFFCSVLSVENRLVIDIVNIACGIDAAARRNGQMGGCVTYIHGTHIPDRTWCDVEMGHIESTPNKQLNR